jgi:hypothetical protein
MLSGMLMPSLMARFVGSEISRVEDWGAGGGLLVAATLNAL